MFTDIFPKIATHLFPDIICTGSDDAVYLTFDDGPDPVVTPKLIDELAELDAKVTFFLSGVNVEKHPQLVKRIAEAGHTIGSHSYLHKPLTFATVRRVRDDLSKADELIVSSMGLDSRLHGNDKQEKLYCKLFRPPHGRIGWGMMRAVRQLGMTVVLWSYSPPDYRQLSAEQIANRVIQHVKPGDIVLLHERETTLKAIAPMILGLKDKGFVLRGL